MVLLNTGQIASPVETVSVSTEIDCAFKMWRQLECCACYTPYQAYAWCDAWMRIVAPQSGESPLIITGVDSSGTPSILLPLVLYSRFSAKVASFPGGKHANFKMPLYRKDITFSTDVFERVLSVAAQIRPDIDLYAFDSLPASWNGLPNPFLSSHARLHTAEAFVLRLAPDPHALFENNLGPKRLRKKRAIDRTFDRLGFRCYRANSSSEIDEALLTYDQQKSTWFLARGIENPFKQPGIVTFLADLAMNPDSGFEVYCLRANTGYILAVAAILVGSGRASLMFVSHDYHSPEARLSPGNKLVREIISSACRRRLLEFDFGLGEAGHKMALGGKSEVTYSLLRPKTPRGHLAAALFEAERRAKILAKSHPALLSGMFRCRGALQQVSRRRSKIAAA